MHWNVVASKATLANTPYVAAKTITTFVMSHVLVFWHKEHGLFANTHSLLDGAMPYVYGLGCRH